MIRFSCPCGMKFKVKDEFAGRSSKCPTCKQPLTVPAPDKTVAFVADEPIDGNPSSLAKAGVDGGVNLGTTRAAQKSVHEILTRQTKKGQRYIIEGELARGGMGAILRAVDCDIRREVAVKFMLDERDPKKKLRFVEEAQITGQLEHPNIVPIHELGVDSQGRLFFSMKMVKGRSLGQVLDELRKNPKTAEKEYSLGRLLNILVNVCHAVAYAHSRGVVHRDLKPANIMLGDFGEVYVMDWGLAKVRGQEAGGRQESAQPASALASKVSTSREAEADLTQEGAIVGTPVYMPPEQAMGNIDQIDERSDIYSLGAILYEILTLQPPIDKEGGYLAILMRVCQGEILPPEQRTPQRAGRIPKELSAVAMKALAKEPRGRYSNVEALRQDIERFQEGRSVSAKDDTFREAVWKMVKRNKAVSTVAALALIVVAIISGWSARNNYLERKAKVEYARKLVPAYVRAAEVSVTDQRMDDALGQIAFALDYVPEHPEALLLRGKVHIAQQQFALGRTDLERYLRQRGDDAPARRLVELCQQANPRDATTLAPFVSAFLQSGEFGLARAMGRGTDEILAFYRQRIETAWPGLGKQLTIDANGRLHLNLKGSLEIKDLTPLRGVPLTSLSIAGGSGSIRVNDLSPLQGMRLTTLHLSYCAGITDLTPLQDMPLASLRLHHCGIKLLTSLEGMSLTEFHLDACQQVSDLTPLRGRPSKTLRELSLWNCENVKDLTPLEDMKLEKLGLPPKVAKGMEVVKRMTTLKGISTWQGSGTLRAADFLKQYDAGKFKGQYEP